MDDLAAVKTQLEYLFLKKIIADLRAHNVDVPTVKKLCQEFLSIEPFTSPEDATQKITSFVTNHTEFAELKKYSDAVESEKDVAAKITKMREHIKANNLDAALEVAKNA